MLTSTEQRVLKIFRDYTDREGQPPLLREIGQALGIRPKGTLHRYVRSLIGKDYLQEGQGGWREPHGPLAAVSILKRRGGAGASPVYLDLRVPSL